MLTEIGIRPGSAWLDVGCGMKPYEELFMGARYCGIDVPSSGRSAELKRADSLFDGRSLPMADASFDGVICTQVLEHAAEPEALLTEIARVLKSGAPAILTMPFVWPQHEKPYDFLRYTEFEARQIVERAGLRVERQTKTTGSIGTITQLLSTYLSQDLIAKLPAGRGFSVAAICGPLQLMGLALEAVLPDGGDLYLDNTILARKP